MIPYEMPFDVAPLDLPKMSHYQFSLPNKEMADKYFEAVTSAGPLPARVHLVVRLDYAEYDIQGTVLNQPQYPEGPDSTGSYRVSLVLQDD